MIGPEYQMLHMIKVLIGASVINLLLIITGYYLNDLLFDPEDGLNWVHVASSVMAMAEISAIFMFSEQKIADCRIALEKKKES